LPNKIYKSEFSNSLARVCGGIGIGVQVGVGVGVESG